MDQRRWHTALEQVSGVSGALQGHSDVGGNSATLYEAQSQNATIALTDLFDTFTAFRQQRNNLLYTIKNNSL